MLLLSWLPRGGLGRATLDDHDVIWRQLSRRLHEWDASLSFISLSKGTLRCTKGCFALFHRIKERFIALHLEATLCFAFYFYEGMLCFFFYHRRKERFTFLLSKEHSFHRRDASLFISIALFIEEHFAFFMEGTLHRRDAFIYFYEGTL